MNRDQDLVLVCSHLHTETTKAAYRIAEVSRLLSVATMIADGATVAELTGSTPLDRVLEMFSAYGYTDRTRWPLKDIINAHHQRNQDDGK